MSVYRSPPEQEIYASPLSNADEEELLHTSVTNSRKRYLSPGVLRGEQIEDRLHLQEASASPFLKKTRTNATPTEPGMALSSAEFREYMAEHVTKRLDRLETTVEGVDNTVRSHTKKIDNHETLIKESQTQIAVLRREVEEVKSRELTPRPTDATPGRFAARVPEPRIGEAEYGLARRSLRIWPIIGRSGEELWRAIGNFLHNLLELPNITEDKVEKIARPDRPSSFGAKDEALIIFKAAETRDEVIGASAKLAPRVDAHGKPTAGIRIEVPAALRVDFRTLHRFGQQLRNRHGAGTRRHVKFDDVSRSLYLNVKLPGDERWSRVEVELARRGIQLRNRLDSQEMEDRFDINGPLAAPRARPASTSSVQSSLGRSESWTGRRTESTSS